jgi:hypothetical protein
MHSDSKKRRSFVALLFAAGDAKRWAAAAEKLARGEETCSRKAARNASRSESAVEGWVKKRQPKRVYCCKADEETSAEASLLLQGR